MVEINTYQKQEVKQVFLNEMIEIFSKRNIYKKEKKKLKRNFFFFP